MMMINNNNKIKNKNIIMIIINFVTLKNIMIQNNTKLVKLVIVTVGNLIF